MSAGPYRRDVDGLRAVAVLAVVGFHAFPNFIRGGFVGVDIFFVISGYLITGILLKEGCSASSFNIAAFYARRIRRIFPALIVVVLACLLFGWYVLLADEFSELGKHLAGASLFASNFVLWQEAGYFDASANAKPLLHLWSLAIEEQFYLAFPLLLVLLRRWRTPTWRLLLALALVSFAANLLGAGGDASGMFYSPVTRAWELLAGGVLACLVLDRHANTPAAAQDGKTVALARQSATLMGSALIGFAILGFDPSMAYPGWRALVPTLGAVLIIAAGPQAWVNRRVLSVRVLVGIGLISYPLYLWHWPVLKYHLIARGELVNAGERLGLVALSFALAWLTWRFVELPVRWRSGVRVAQALFASLLALGGLGAAAALGVMPPRHHATGLEHILSATTDWQFPPRHFSMLLFEGHRFFTQRTSLPGTVLFIGDSNVQQYAIRLDALLDNAPTRYRSVVFATRGGCLPVPGYDQAPPGCEAQLNAALRYAERFEVERVVIGGYWLNIPQGQARDAALRLIGSLMAKLSKTKKVYLLMNIPAGPPFDPRNMFTGSRLTTIYAKQSPTALSLADFLGEYGALREALVATAAASGATAIDPLPWLCTSGACPVVSDDGRPLYMDEHHMRPFHAARSAGYLDVTVKAAQPLPPMRSDIRP